MLSICSISLDRLRHWLPQELVHAGGVREELGPPLPPGARVDAEDAPVAGDGERDGEALRRMEDVEGGPGGLGAREPGAQRQEVHAEQEADEDAAEPELGASALGELRPHPGVRLEDEGVAHQELAPYEEDSVHEEEDRPGEDERLEVGRLIHEPVQG